MKTYFSLDPEIIYLNHAAVAPLPINTSRAVQEFVAECSLYGAQYYPRWLKIEQELREMLAALINAPSSKDISLLKSTSEGLSVIAYGLEWSHGDNIVSIAQEFPSNRIVWESLSRTYGVELRFLDLNMSNDPEGDLIELCDENTRLITVSSVQYIDGLRLDLERIGKHANANNILFCVDAIQSLGALPFDVQACGADFVVADGHKWMFGPEGLALFYTNESVRYRLNLQQFGWHMVQDPSDFERSDWAISPTGTRFECGSPNMLGIHALHASISIINEIGLETISRKIINNIRLLIELANNNPSINPISSTAPERISGIFSFTVAGGNSSEIVTRLMSEGVVCAQRGGGIRFSPHFYNTAAEIELALKKVESLAAK
jgi:cysteine desulfurase / selenocysteine lyase